jgi:hypothetical protein
MMARHGDESAKRDPHDKFGEAQFFVGHMEAEHDNWQQKHPMAFRYYLSAFLTACESSKRDIEKTVVMRLRKENAPHESGKKARLPYETLMQDWEKGLSQEERACWDFIGDLRDPEVHEKRTETIVTTKKVPIPYSEHRHPGYVQPMSQPIAAIAATIPGFQGDLQDGVLQGWMGMWRTAEEHRFSVHDDVLPVIAGCKQYLQILDRYIAYFERFSENEQISSKGGSDGKDHQA